MSDDGQVQTRDLLLVAKPDQNGASMKLGTAKTRLSERPCNAALSFGVRACETCPENKTCPHWLARAAIALDKALSRCRHVDRFAQLLSEEPAFDRYGLNGKPTSSASASAGIDRLPGLALDRADAEIVRGSDAFRGVNGSVINRLIAASRTISFDQGEVVFHQGDPATALFIVVEGWVKLYRITVGGDVAVIDIFAKGESLWQAVVLGERVHLATAEAVIPARVVRIPAEEVLRLIQSAPELALAMIASASRRVCQLIEQLEHLKAKTGLQRVAEFLASLCSNRNGTCVISLPYDKFLIASWLGLTPEYFSRVLAKLRTIGVEVHASDVLVRDVGRLHHLADRDRTAARGFTRRS